MYPQHERATQNLVALFKEDPEVLAVVLAGSLAKGLERPDSDVDAIIAVTEEKYRRLQMEGRTSECIEEGCGYEGGYFDLKYYTKDYLLAAAAHGSEPTRYAFTGSYCLFSRDAELPEIVARIPVFQKAEKEEKMLSFYAALLLYSGYFWDCSKRENRYLQVKSAAMTVLYGLRLVLEDAGALFPCQKNLMKAVDALPAEKKPAGIVEKANRFLELMTDEAKEDFVRSVLGFIAYKPPQNLNIPLSRFIRDHEEWWYDPRPFIEEW